jgi:hypothetical protein
MRLFSDDYLFPFVQFVLIAGVVAIALRDFWPHRAAPDIQGSAMRANAHVARGDKSMGRLGVAYGFLLSLIVAVINQGAFRGDHWWKDYSVVINVVDFAAIVYICYVSGWSRNKILGLSEWLRIER